MKPYYDDGHGIVIYHGDCRDILPSLPKVDLVLTDPPCPSYHVVKFHYTPDLILLLDKIPCRQFVFWTPSCVFPLTYGGKRIWDKAVGTNTQFEEIYERNGSSGYIIHRAYSMGCFSSVGAQMTREIVTGHPSQKPLKLITMLIAATDSQLIFDPFMGSGKATGAAGNRHRDRRAVLRDRGETTEADNPPAVRRRCKT